MRESLATLRVRRSYSAFAFNVGLLVEVLMDDGQIEEGLTVVAEGLDLIRRTGQCSHEPELYRLKGELLFKHAADSTIMLSEAESCFNRAVEIARAQSAKAFELRAVMSLCHLYAKQGKKEEAREILSEAYGWFTEGFNTIDLKAARRLLDELSTQ